MDNCAIEVDVEAHQPRVFTESGAAKFFRVVDVPVVIMEFPDCRRQNASDHARSVSRFFAERQYQVFSQNDRPLGPDCSTWPTDVVFTKRSLAF